MLYLNFEIGSEDELYFNLTLTSVVFEFFFKKHNGYRYSNLTLTSVVFE